MSFSLLTRWVASLLLVAGIVELSAETYETLDGKTLQGPPISITRDGVAFRDASGSQGERVGYTNLTQASIQELIKNPKAKKFAEPFLEISIEAGNTNRPVFEVKPFERLDRPDPQGGIGKLGTSSIGMVFLLLLLIGNLYSAYEVGVFRNYNPWMVLGISVVAPVLTQIIFLCLPTYVPKSAEEHVDATAAHVPTFASAGGAPGAAAAAAASQAAAEAAVGTGPTGLPIYKRGEYTFNKRFFETKMSGFFGIRPSDAEKGLVCDIQTNKGHLTCNRVVRVTPAEVCLQVMRNSTIEEVNVVFTDILQIEIKQRS